MPVHRAAALGAAFASAVLLTAASKDSPSAHGIDLAGIDHSVAPGDDFFAYANGAWIKKTEIPADKASYGPGRNPDREDARAGSRADPGCGEGASARRFGCAEGRRLLRELPRRGRDRRERVWRHSRTTWPASRRSANRQALSTYLGSTLRADVDALNATNFYTDNIFGVWISQAFENPSHNVPYVMQGGLGMPDRDYYIAKSAKMEGIRAKYRAHIAAMLKLAGIADADDARRKASSISKPGSQKPTRRAKIPKTCRRRTIRGSAPISRRRRRGSTGTPISRRRVWPISRISSSGIRTAIVGTSALVASEPVGVWKDYLAYRLIEHFANVLPVAFVDERFAFYGTTLNGTPKMPRSLEARHRFHERQSRRSGRQALCREIFPAVGQGQDRGDGEGTCSRPITRASQNSPGCRRRRRRRRSPSSRPCASASAIPTSGRTIPRSRSCAATRWAISAARRCSSTSAISPSCMNRSIAASG